MKELILLDSDSNITIMRNRKHVTNACGTADTMHAETNGGVTATTQKFYIPDIREHWFSENSITNILSLSDIVDKYCVTLDANEEKAFKVYFPRKIVKFKQLSDCLYGLLPSDSSSYSEYPTLQLNKSLNFANDKCFSKAMKRRASKAQKACIASGTPNFASFKAAMRANSIRNDDVVTEDTQIAEKACGADLGGMKSKSTRSKPEAVKRQVITMLNKLLLSF